MDSPVEGIRPCELADSIEFSLTLNPNSKFNWRYHGEVRAITIEDGIGEDEEKDFQPRFRLRPHHFKGTALFKNFSPTSFFVWRYYYGRRFLTVEEEVDEEGEVKVQEVGHQDRLDSIVPSQLFATKDFTSYVFGLRPLTREDRHSTFNVVTLEDICFQLDDVCYTTLPPFTFPPSGFDHEEFPLNHALWLVTMAKLVYHYEESVQEVVQYKFGMDEFQFFEDSETDTQCFCGATDEFIVACFRGTESLTDVVVDIDLRFKTWPGEKDAKYHTGFGKAVETVIGSVEDFILNEGGKKQNPDKPLYLCGHSLGGALAAMALAYLGLRDDPFIVNGVVTIGQPMVGNKAFANLMKEKIPHIPMWRIVNSNDIIPCVPNGPYAHFGTIAFFREDGELQLDESAYSISQQKLDTWLENPLTSISNHGSAEYVGRIRQHYAKMAQPRKKAIIKVEKAVGLRSADYNLKGEKKTCDPYAKITYGPDNFESSKKDKTKNPVWNWTYEISSISPLSFLSISIWDKDAVDDDFLGLVNFHFSHSWEDVPMAEFQLQGRDDEKWNIKGSVFLSITFVDQD